MDRRGWFVFVVAVVLLTAGLYLYGWPFMAAWGLGFLTTVALIAIEESK